MRFLLAAIISLFASHSFAAPFVGGVSFTENDKRIHEERINIILQEASHCLDEHLEKHKVFYKKWGISPFYGSASSFSKLSVAARKEQLKKLRLPPELVDQMQPVSCIGLALKCLKRGFHNAGQEAVWKQIETFTVKNNGSGMALQDALQNLGWRVLYWNPNVSMNEIWDQREQAKNPNNTDRFWGYHAYRWATINKNQKYYYNYVDDYSTLVNFGESVPRSILRTPFFVGTAHTGYHVFPGAYGQIIEGHSTRAITDSQTVESSPFNPLATGGGPRGLYRSGLMAVPPGY